jgi:hypothetical protein
MKYCKIVENLILQLYNKWKPKVIFMGHVDYQGYYLSQRPKLVFKEFTSQQIENITQSRT